MRIDRVFGWAAVLAALVLGRATDAQALQFRILGIESPRGLADIYPGDEFTISLRIEGASGLYGLGASAWGFDESVVDFVTGSSVASINHAVALPAVGAFNGLTNVLVNPLVETSIGTNGNRVLFFNGVGLSSTNTNVLDPGLDGVVGGGDAQVRLTFRSIGPGTAVINLGTGYEGDGAVYAGGLLDQGVNTQILIGMIPEPGTAILLGLGLASLSASRGRRQG